MIFSGIGKSNTQDPFEAGKEAAREAQIKLKKEGDLVFLFSSPRYHQKKVLEGVKSIFENAKILGLSTAGEITINGSFSNHVVTMALNTPEIEWTLGIGKNGDKDSFQAGRALAEEIKEKLRNPLSLLILFMDGFLENPQLALRGIEEVLGRKFPILGAAAGDDFHFKKTFEYFNQEILTGAIIGIGVSGKISLGMGISFGFKPIGLPMKITKAVGREIIEIDGKPAFSIYEKFFEKRAKDLMEKPFSRITSNYPLGIALENQEEFLIRNPIKANENGKVIFLGEVPEGSMVQFMIGDEEKMIQETKEIAENVLFEIKGKIPRFGFIFESAFRSKILGERKKDEINALRNILGERDIIGFYSYGEIFSKKSRQKSPFYFQNGSIVLVLFGD